MSALRRACFFDRDGVLNVDHGYVVTQDRFEWMPGAIDAIRWLNTHDYLVIVITNQSGVARGIFTLEQCNAFMDWMQEELSARGARFDGVYVCPHHPSEGETELTRDCECRKPKPGLFLQAIADFGIDVEASFAVGDKVRDIEAATRAGVSAELYLGGDLLDCVKGLHSKTNLARQ